MTVRIGKGKKMKAVMAWVCITTHGKTWNQSDGAPFIYKTKRFALAYLPKNWRIARVRITEVRHAK